MKNIELTLLNPESLISAQKAMLFGAKLTQHSEDIKDTDDIMTIYDRPVNTKAVKTLSKLPHVTLQKFEVINIVVTGLSRRALAQLTRHQNEVKFMAGSLQYSDHSGKQNWTYPAGMTEAGKKLLESYYETAAGVYDALIGFGETPDTAGYAMPQGFKTTLMISATPYQWKHMIAQRVCRRNTPEVRLIMLKAAKLLWMNAPALFEDAGPACMNGGCKEGKFYCGAPITEFEKELRELEEADEKTED